MSSTENNYVNTDLGNVALNSCGEYNADSSYEYLDTVNYEGGSYFCKVEFPKKISGIAPKAGVSTEFWQLLTIPGDATSEYIKLHDEVVNKAKQVETSRAAVELSQQEIEAAQADVSQMRQDTQEAAEEAASSRDSAAGYAQSAETSRTAAAESEQNINAQVNNFNTHVSEKTSVAEASIEEARKKAIDAVTTQQDLSIKAVTDEETRQTNAAIKAVTTQQNNSVQAIADEASEQIKKIKDSLDKGLSEEGKAADAKATGDAISVLKKDLDYKIGKTAVGERELKFINIGYANASDGMISSSQNAQNTGFCRIDGVSRIIAHVNLSKAGAKIAFYSRNKEYLKDISIVAAITDPNYTEIDLDITSDVYANAKYCIISNYGSGQKIAKVIGTVAPYSAKATADEAKATADEAITPIRTTFFDEVNIGVPENVENVQRFPNSNGVVISASDVWSLIFKCKPNTDYYIYIPGINRKNVVESETNKFVDGETYTILPISIINYSGVNVVKITTGENAKRIMFYYFNGSYDYDANKDKIIILENKWVASPYVHIPSQYLPKEIVNKSKHYGTFSIIGDSYSSFKGYMANANAATWYPASDHNMNDTNDVENVEQTWWYKFANTYNSRLLENNSWSGSTIAYDSYSEGLDDGKETSFIQRMNLITTPQLILIYGGTNDSWAAVDTKRDDFLGEYKYSDFSESDFIYFRPALAYLLDKLKHKHIGAKIIFMLNSSLNNIKESVHEICNHYGIGVCEIRLRTLIQQTKE